MCIYICVHVYTHVYIYMCTHGYICIYVHMYIYGDIYIYLYKSVAIYHRRGGRICRTHPLRLGFRKLSSRSSQTNDLSISFLSLPSLEALIGSDRYWIAQSQDHVSEWNIRSWCRWPNFLVGHDCKVTMSAHCTTLNIASMNNSNNQTYIWNERLCSCSYKVFFTVL